MNPETKNTSAGSVQACQNCKQNFEIDAQDFAFYERISVPAPTFCFDCRVERRMAFRNERVLYKRKCEAPGHGELMISIFSPDNPQKVYCHSSWWGDSWDPLAFGREVDFSRSFLAQIKELWREVPDISVLNINPVNSEYCSITEGNKNCYLVFGGDFNENTLYSTYVFHSKECMDTYWVQKSELNYETVDCISCARLSFSRYCEGVYDSSFLFNCRNCHDCVGCVNMINKSFCILNEQYTKEAYLKKVKELALDTFAGLEAFKKKFAEHSLRFPRRFAKMLQVVNSSGDNLENCKNGYQCFDIFEGGEDCRHMFLSYSKVKDSMDVDRVGLGAELGYDSSTIYPGSRVFFSRFIFNCHDIQYSYNCHNSDYLFGCVGLRNKQYCILNKQYSKEEYEALMPRLIELMNTMPYVEAGGRTYQYGEFFPVELSPFAYNETLAEEMHPITESEAAARGYRWRMPESKGHVPTLTTENIPSSISSVPDAIVDEIIACEHAGECSHLCTKAFKITPAELALYRRMKVPIPHLCSSCRHFGRIAQRNPMKLWRRRCDCQGSASARSGYSNGVLHAHGEAPCESEFETTYAPEKPEMVYCESCYQAEVA